MEHVCVKKKKNKNKKTGGGRNRQPEQKKIGKDETKQSNTAQWKKIGDDDKHTKNEIRVPVALPRIAIPQPNREPEESRI